MLVSTLFLVIFTFLIVFLMTLKLLRLNVAFEYDTVLLVLVLLVPLGLAMDFVHESGHAIWGAAFGGRVVYMQIAYFEIYPRLAVAPRFVLGLTEVEGIQTDFGRGFYLLGGALTTNIVSWLLALVMFRTKLGFKTKLGLRIMGVFGLLDLPFYVVFPQIGLCHWIIFGGCQPEPLIGARMMGLPDVFFYTCVLFTTLGLSFFYFESVWKRIQMSVRSLQTNKT